jgi:hypothetical protein
MDVDPATFDTLLGRLSRAEFEAFVVDLWRARGWTVVREDGGLRATDRFGDEYVLHVGRVDGGSPSDTAANDLLVTTDPERAPPGVEVVGPADLRHLIQYAVDPETGRSLFVRTFGRPPEAETSSPADWIDRRMLAAALVVLAGVAMVVLGFAVDGPEVSDTAVDAAADAGEPPSPATATRSPDDVNVGALPAGVEPNGSIDPETVTRSHREAVDGESYRLTISYRELGGGEPGGTARERIVVESNNVYVTDLFVTGRLTNEDGIIADTEAYAEGGIHYQRPVNDTGEGLGTRRIGSAVSTQYADRVEALLLRYLSAEESRLIASFGRDGRTNHWITLRERSGPGAENVSASAVIDERGVVHSVRSSYEIPESGGRSAVVSIQYERFGDARVTRPDWYEQARNRSATRRAALSTAHRGG